MSNDGLQAHVIVRRSGFDLDVDLAVAPGEVVAVVGPNGAGKSTLLAALAGLVPLSAGRIGLGDAVWDDPVTGRFVPSAQRRCGVVFQDYRLFAALSVRDNVAFGARCRGLSARAARREAQPWLERFGLSGLASRRPGGLSGGQAQRVALARAWAARPAMLLLDEPLAALDVRSRAEIHLLLRAQTAVFTGPILLITHDPLDAVVLADRMVVVEDGRVTQYGPPGELSRRPVSSYLATMLGLNLFRGAVAAGRFHAAAGAGFGVHAPDRPVALAAVRPSAISVHVVPPPAAAETTIWAARIDTVSARTDRIQLSTVGALDVLVDVSPGDVSTLGLTPGREVWLQVSAADVEVYPV